jgi:hypothetical protein
VSSGRRDDEGPSHRAFGTVIAERDLVDGGATGMDTGAGEGPAASIGALAFLHSLQPARALAASHPARLVYALLESGDLLGQLP